MDHLTPETLLDLAEGTRAESSAPHLASCGACRRDLSGLRDALAATSAARIPDPSPLFWEHFSARVRQSIAEDSVSTVRHRARWGGWRWAGAAVSAAAVVVAMVLVQPAPEEAGAPLAGASGAGMPALDRDPVMGGPDVPVNLISDVSVDFIADLAGELDWDAAAEAGLTQAGAIDRLVFELSADERAELHRLLQVELGRHGV
jgi:hypothetical protein